MYDLPCWLFNERLNSTENQKSFTLWPRNQQENNVPIMKNYKTKISEIQNSIISTLINIFIYGYQFFAMFVTAIYSFAKHKINAQSKRTISQAELNFKNLDDIIETLKVYATKAEREQKQVASHFQDMKSQIEKQEEVLDKNLIEINNLKVEINEASLKSVQQNEIIESLEQELEKSRQQLSKSANNLADITKQLESSISSESTNELQKIDESDEDYICILNRIRDMKVKIQQQENHLSSILQLINKLDELHNFDKTIDQQTKTIYNLQDGLRRKSADIFENLRNIVGRVTESTSLDNNAEFEVLKNLQVFDESLNVIEQNTKSFIEGVGTQLDLLDDDKGQITLSRQRYSDTTKQNISGCVIQNSTEILDTSMISVEESRSYQSTVIEKDCTTLEKGIQTIGVDIERNDAGCQTIESPFKSNDSVLSSVKDMLRKTLGNFNSVQELHERMRETLQAYKLEREHHAEKSHDTLMIIDDLEKGVVVLETQIKDDLRVIDELKKENVNLKELVHTAEKEIYGLKNEIAMLSLSEQEKDKKISVLEEDLKMTKESYEQNITFLEREAENQKKDFTSLNQKLMTEKENVKNLKQHYELINDRLKQQIKTRDEKIMIFRIDNDMLRNTCETLKTKFNDTNVEHCNAIKKKDKAILFYKAANKGQSLEIQNLKEEVKKVLALPQEEREKYRSRTPLKENVRYRSPSNFKEYDGHTQIPRHVFRNITLRWRSNTSPINRQNK